jgi:HEAT repeat protein
VLFHVKDVKQNRVEDTLREVLEGGGETTQPQRWEAARVLAFHLNEASPDKVGEVLLDMLKANNLELYQGAESRVGDTGENRGNTAVKENRGGDARFLAAMALGWMGRTANKPAIVEELSKAQQQDRDERLKKHAAEALDRIKRGVRREP